ncbi:hypothetical protein C1645_814473 [Glomus cerebriforme]|uniref:F-box domain-containing protein n=1 Tax=Glomus cerebriforme TaxID=658196 RepID=A0A397TPX7_9GLOM|nr:hypothetical protein C1645_814473 [Glomus cerebriforme]
MSEAGWNCVGSQRPTVMRCSSLTVSASRSSLIVNIPCEIFIDICKFLPPLDLFTLSLVCKNFRNWLIARSNFGTEQIWKTARINWLTNLRSPPSGISEQCYVFLHLIELGCQFCGNGKIDPRGPNLPCEIPAKIYWCFRVRCCQQCFLERTITSKQIKEERRINIDVLQVLPYYVKNNRPVIYWKSQVEAAHQEYVKLDRKDLNKWMHEKSIQLENLNKIAEGCAGQTQAELLKKKQIVNRLNMLINKLSLVVPNDANRIQRQVEVELKRCDIYKKYTSHDQKANFAIKLFNENHWDLFQNQIRQEYEEKRKYAALRAQQFDIFRKVYSMIPEEFSMNDPIVKYLPYCRSFKRPYWDVTIPWENNFLEEELIPTLCGETAAIAKRSEKPLPITTLTYALKSSSLKNRRIFQCKICVNNEKPTPIFNLKEVNSHLSSPLHGVKDILLKKMVTINYLAVGKNILKRDSQVVCFFFPFDD